MGSEVCRAVAAATDVALVAGVDPSIEGEALHDVIGVASETGVLGSVSQLDPTEVDVVVDFTHVAVSREVLDWCAADGVHAVVGTTGFTEDEIERFRNEFTDSNALIAPNLSLIHI